MKTSFLLTFTIAFLGAYSYARAGGCVLETAEYWGLGVASTVLAVHRMYYGLEGK